MCNKSEVKIISRNAANNATKLNETARPAEKDLPEPSLLARYTCASILVGIMAVWGKYTFIEESALQVGEDIHSYKVPLALTAFYLVSLPLLRASVDRYTTVDMKMLLKESMILYNGAQVVLNAWMVYRMVDAVAFRGHPFVGGIRAGQTGATYAVWGHYCDKYLEFLDTYFMVLRGKMDQVGFCRKIRYECNLHPTRAIKCYYSIFGGRFKLACSNLLARN